MTSVSLLSGIKLALITAAAVWLSNAQTASPAMACLGGVTLLAILFGYDGGAARSVGQGVAFGLAGGAAFMLAAMPIAGMVPVIAPPVSALTELWIAGALIVFLIDRMRGPAQEPVAASSRAERLSLRPEPTAPRLVRNEPVAQPAVAAPSFTPTPAFTQTPSFTPAPIDPPAAPVAPVAAATTAAVPPNAIPLKGGKPVEIYVNLMGEGMTMLRTVRAEHIGKDYYHIIEEMPSNERWEFQPGQVVRCQKKSLSHGKGLVAVSEAPRAQ